jgi:hypothetical protein
MLDAIAGGALTIADVHVVSDRYRVASHRARCRQRKLTIWHCERRKAIIVSTSLTTYV